MFDRVVAFALLACIGLLLYAWQLDAPWQFDDYDAIVNNERLLKPDGVSFIERMQAPPQSPFAGRPVVSFTAALNAELTGLRPWAWRAFNLFIHITNAALAMLIIARLSSSPSPQGGEGRGEGEAPQSHHPLLWPFTIALLWLVHPVCTEPVMYITQRTTLLMAMFYLATLYFILRRGWWMIPAGICLVFGMASKESMVTFPVAMVLIDAACVNLRPRRRWTFYLMLAMSWGVLAVLMASGPRSETVGFGRGVSAFDYATNQCVMIVTYLKLAVWPHPLVFDYGYPHPLPVGVWGPCAVVVVAGVVGSLWLYALPGALSRKRLVGVAALLFFVLLAPTSSFVPITSEVGAERRMYLPLLCIIILLAAAVRHLKPRAALAIAACIGLSVLTVMRTADYASSERLWATVVEARPTNPRGHNNYARLIARQRGDEAIAHLQQAIALKGDYADARFNLGILLAMRGDTPEAIEHIREAVRLRPDRADWRQVLDRAERDSAAAAP